MTPMWLTRLKTIGTAFATYIAIVGFVGFTLFILEEALQTMTFSMFQIKNSRHFVSALRTTEKMESVNHGMWLINTTLNWINPPSWYAYDSFYEATECYVESTRAWIFSEAPELFNGRKISITFKPSSVIDEGGIKWAVNGRIRVSGRSEYKIGLYIPVEGIVSLESQKVTIREDVRNHEKIYTE